jgi:hypothetical protein
MVSGMKHRIPTRSEYPPDRQPLNDGGLEFNIFGNARGGRHRVRGVAFANAPARTRAKTNR